MNEQREIEMLVEGIAADVLQILVSKDGYSLEEALDYLYKSRTFHALERPETGLYYQSPVYIYDCLQSEYSKQ